MARKRMDVGFENIDGELLEHAHAHVMGCYVKERDPEFVVTVLELQAVGGAYDGDVVRVALCPHCILKLAQIAEQVIELYPKAFVE